MSGAVAWVTGLPASGKSTLARHVQDRLRAQGRECILLDGDEVRGALSQTLSYDEEGRAAFYESLSRLAALLARQGHLVVVAATANLRRYREQARWIAPRFLEVYVSTPVAVCAERDPKGLYRAQKTGDVASLPGVDAPYEPPLSPEVVAEGGHDPGAVERVARALTMATTAHV